MQLRMVKSNFPFAYSGKFHSKAICEDAISKDGKFEEFEQFSQKLGIEVT